MKDGLRPYLILECGVSRHLHFSFLILEGNNVCMHLKKKLI